MSSVGPHRFLLDESGFSSAIESGMSVEELLECLVSRVAGVRESCPNLLCLIAKHSDVWNVPVGKHTLSEWLFVPENGLESTLRSAAMAVIDRLADWDQPARLTAVSVCIGGAQSLGFSIAEAVSRNQGGTATGCISPDENRLGELDVSTNAGLSSLYFVDCGATLAQFFRSVIEVEDVDESQFFLNVRSAFPKLVVVPRRFNFGKSFRECRDIVTLHLATLDDHVLGLFSTAPLEVVARLKACGVDASGESPNTRRDQAAMKQRTIVLGDKTVVCDWHTKLWPTLGRIYFSATAIADRVVVGIFSPHL